MVTDQITGNRQQVEGLCRTICARFLAIMEGQNNARVFKAETAPLPGYKEQTIVKIRGADGRAKQRIGSCVPP